MDVRFYFPLSRLLSSPFFFLSFLPGTGTYYGRNSDPGSHRKFALDIRHSSPIVYKY